MPAEKAELEAFLADWDELGARPPGRIRSMPSNAAVAVRLLAAVQSQVLVRIGRTPRNQDGPASIAGAPPGTTW